MTNLMWATVKLGANPLDGAFLQACVRQLLPRQIFADFAGWRLTLLAGGLC